jgi:hypothetical protein
MFARSKIVTPLIIVALVTDILSASRADERAKEK